MIRFFKRPERLLMAAGLVLLGIYGAAWAHRVILSRASLRAFERAKLAPSPAATPTVLAAETPVSPSAAPAPRRDLAAAISTKVDTSLWSEKRIRDYKASLEEHFDLPLAVLRIPKIGLEVPVLEGTDDLTLNRGVGHIEGTPRPGDFGNIGIAGHRDGFFRGLKDIAVGDRFGLVTIAGDETYEVDRITIVSPDDVSVLDDGPVESLTLVTCYPFYFVGDAPQRYIVRAVRVPPVTAR
jgi:sortase A